MAEERTIVRFLRQISEFQPTPFFPERPAELALAQRVAGLIQTLDYEHILPSAPPNEEIHRRANNHEDIRVDNLVFDVLKRSESLVNALRSLNTEPNGGAERSQRIEETKRQANDFCLAAFKILPVLLVTTHEDSLSKSHDLMTQLAKVTDEAHGILRNIQDAASIAATSAHAQTFHSLSKGYSDHATKWLCAAAAVAVITVLAAFGSIWLTIKYPVEGYPQLVQIVVAKLVVLSVLYYAMVWCARTYKANRHLEVVNEHRAKSLQTFEAFVKSTDDPTTKNAVLLETTRAIFVAGTTGFLGSDDGVQSPSQLIEVFKSVTSPRGTDS